MKKFSPKVLISAAVVVIVVIIGVVMLMPKHLSGTYTAKTTLLFVTSTDKMTFSGSNVIENQGTDHENKGTYTIDGDKLTINMGDDKLEATLSKDKQSFTVDDAPGLAALAKGTTYKKN